jgi:hypothetical protein
LRQQGLGLTRHSTDDAVQAGDVTQGQRRTPETPRKAQQAKAMEEISNIDKHFLDPIIKPFGSSAFCLTICMGSLAAGIWLGIRTSEWLWLNRFGGIIIVSGILLTTSPLFSRGIYISQSGAGRWAELDAEGKVASTTKEDREIGRRVALGLVVTVIGTILNAFGDLIGAAIQ